MQATDQEVHDWQHGPDADREVALEHAVVNVLDSHAGEAPNEIDGLQHLAQID